MRHARILRPLPVLLALLTACGTPTTPSAPEEIAGGDGQDVDAAIADSEVTCNPVTDTACCVGGVLSGKPCYDSVTKTIICPSGGTACSTMGSFPGSCKTTCGVDVLDTTDGPDAVDSGVQP